MSNGSVEAKSVLLVDPDEGFLDDAGKLLKDHKTHFARNISDAQRRVVEESIDIALLGPAYAHEAGVAECGLLLDIRPNLPMVLIADTMTTSLLRAALRAGFRDVVDAPLTIRKVDEAMGHVEQIQRRFGDEGAVERARVGKVVTVMSPKGGAGKTVTSTNVATTLAQWAGPGRAVILDADLQFGDVCLSLQIDPRHSIVEASRDIDKLDEQLLDSLLSRHESGLRVLPAPLEPSLADEVSTQAVVKILGMLKRMYDYVVVDTAPFLDEPVLSILERSDDVLLVVDMDLPSVKNAKLALDTLRLIKFPFEKIKLVLNRVNSKARLDVEELERSLDLKVRAAVPSDKLVPRSVNEGIPIVLLNPRSKVTKGFQDVARLVVDERTKAAIEHEGKPRRWFGG